MPKLASAITTCSHSLLLLLLGILAVVSAHGGDAATLHMSHGDHSHNDSMAMPMHMSDDDRPALPSYFSHTEHVGLIYGHIALMILSWVIALPLAVMFSIARSRLAFLFQCLFLATNALGLLVGVFYNTATPDLYENNAHHKLGWAITWIAGAWAAMGLVKLFIRGQEDFATSPAIKPVSLEAMAEYQCFQDNAPLHRYRWSHDSGHGTESHPDSLCSSSRTSSWHSDANTLPMPQAFNDQDEDALEDGEKRSFLHNTKVDRLLSRTVPALTLGRAGTVFTVLYVILERFMILLGFAGIATGFVVYGGIGRANHVFNVLAHLIKGGIFFWYGFLTFGRWIGCFADFGWAWSLKPGAELVGRRTARIPSAEFTESFVIFLYGASNVFLEHLAAWGKAWTAMDFEHVSITIMFFGGGLLGMLIESTTVRQLLSATLLGGNKPPQERDEKWSLPSSYTHSLNPMPALVILLLGIMMSSHTQHSAVSSAIHKQWGMLFAGFALCRGLTYITFWLKPPTGYLPTRPPTEIVASFCLISGGMIFIASNSDTVWALEVFNLDAMFIFTVTMGLTAIFMAWTVVLVAIKSWAVQRGSRNGTRAFPRATLA